MDELVEREFKHISEKLDSMQNESRDYRRQTNEMLLKMAQTLEHTQMLEKRMSEVEGRLWRIALAVAVLSAGASGALHFLIG